MKPIDAGTTEHDLQKAIIRWARQLAFQYPELDRLHMVNNESLASHIPASRRPAFINNLKSLGMIFGVSDLFMPALRLCGHTCKGGLYLELKRPGTNLEKALTDNQDKWLRLLSADYACMAANTLEGAQGAIMDYLSNPHPQEVLNELYCIS